MRVRRGVARLYWRLSRWRLVTEQFPPGASGILLGAPHTSNWDFVTMLAITWQQGLRVRFLGKDGLFRWPWGALMRACGGIPVNRSDAGALVDDLVERARGPEPFALVIAPEGTRGRAEYWKSGFHRIAVQAGLPVTLGYVDRTTRTAGLGPTLVMTGDVGVDMDRVREFYADKAGIRPSRRVEPRLRSEDDAAGDDDG